MEIETIEETEIAGYEGECAGCEMFGRISDLGLCEACSAKLERDLIRQREWAYGVTVHGQSDREREEVRRRIVREFGAGLELIEPTRPAKPGRKRRKGKKRK